MMGEWTVYTELREDCVKVGIKDGVERWNRSRTLYFADTEKGLRRCLVRAKKKADKLNALERRIEDIYDEVVRDG